MNAPVDFNALKTRQQSACASGDCAVIGTTLQLVGELLAEACLSALRRAGARRGRRQRQRTLAAARRGCRVTSTH